MLAGVGAANGVDEDDESAGVGFDRPDHAAVFDLSMDYSDDDVLLDWEQYSGAHADRVHAKAPLGHFIMSNKERLTAHACMHAEELHTARTHLQQGEVTPLFTHCRWKKVHFRGAGCDLAGESVPLVPLLGASRVVSTGS